MLTIQGGFLTNFFFPRGKLHENARFLAIPSFSIRIRELKKRFQLKFESAHQHETNSKYRVTFL